MSTRASVKITDSFGDELWFYRHSDGYPEGTLPTLKIFCDWVREGRIRDNCGQACGWLILIGASEYSKVWRTVDGELKQVDKETIMEPISGDSFMGWKCSSYEPATCAAGDAEFLYTIDLDEKTISVECINSGKTVSVSFIFSPDLQELYV